MIKDRSTQFDLFMMLKLATISSKGVMLDKSLNNSLTFLSRHVGPDPTSSLPRNKIDTAIYIYMDFETGVLHRISIQVSLA